MFTLAVYHLRFALAVETALELNQHQGAALRGMLFNALRGPKHNPALGFCAQRHLKTCADCALAAACPVAGLVSTLNPQAERGRDIPRPYALVPPLPAQTRYEPGRVFTFGLTLFGQALNLFPYVVMALRQAGPNGLGKTLPQSGGRPRRGCFALRSAHAINLLTGETQDVLEPGSNLVQRPGLPVTHSQIVETSRYWLAGAETNNKNGRFDLTLTFITPTRLVAQKRLLKTPHFAPLFHRLLERLLTLEEAFGRPEAAPTELIETRPDKNSLLALADRVELVDDRTGWEEVWSYSARQGKKTPIGGLMGPATYRASGQVWETLLPYLMWGQVIHVGKNVVKGDGMIAVSRQPGAGSREPVAGSR